MTASSAPRRGAVPALDVVARLTERDRCLCRVLWEHRVLTTHQVCELCFTSLTSAQHRLVTLWRLGVLERFRPLRPTGSESWRYTLGPLGAMVAAAERGVVAPRPSVVRDRAVALAAGQRTAHTLGVNGFFTALHAATRRTLDAKVGAWWSERRCAAEWGDFVRPDAFGIWEEMGRRVEFFLEYDTGTETLERVAVKLDGYRDLAEADGASRPVLFWLAQPGREAGLRRAVKGTTVAVATAVAGAGCPADTVWLAAGEELPRRHLVDLSSPQATGGP